MFAWHGQRASYAGCFIPKILVYYRVKSKRKRREGGILCQIMKIGKKPLNEGKGSQVMDFEYFYGKQSSQYAFYRIPKQLFTESQFDTLSIGAKLLYGMMIDRMELSQKNGWIDKRGRAYIYFTVDEVKGRFHCANDKAVKLMKELDSDKGIGLIESVRQELRKPNIIYVKNFVGGSQA